jgi:ABC-type dipeptide/oligopeptide/nickel transport system permease subunit
MLRHVLPNVLNSVVVLAILDVGRAIILESSLSFLGVGHPAAGRLVGADARGRPHADGIRVVAHDAAGG